MAAAMRCSIADAVSGRRLRYSAGTSTSAEALTLRRDASSTVVDRSTELSAGPSRGIEASTGRAKNGRTAMPFDEPAAAPAPESMAAEAEQESAQLGRTWRHEAAGPAAEATGGRERRRRPGRRRRASQAGGGPTARPRRRRSTIARVVDGRPEAARSREDERRSASWPRPEGRHEAAEKHALAPRAKGKKGKAAAAEGGAGARARAGARGRRRRPRRARSAARPSRSRSPRRRRPPPARSARRR